MKAFIFILLLAPGIIPVHAQKIKSVHINLYTDSLKKGTHNYINVDGQLEDGSWKPLTDKELAFTADYGRFEGNNLVLPENPTVKKVHISVSLKDKPKDKQQVTIWIKQQPDPLLINDDTDARPGRRKKRG